MDVGLIVSIVGALGVGSLVGQYLAGGQARRESRSKVLSCLAQVESLRWVYGSDDIAEFIEAVRDFQTSALVARLPRRAVRHHINIAYAGRWMSQQSFDQFPDPENGGAIAAEFADLATKSAAAIAQLTWNPWIARVGLGLRLAYRKRQAREMGGILYAQSLQRGTV